MTLLFFLSLALVDGSARIEIEVDGVIRSLVAGPRDDPLEVAERFCKEYDLSRSVEGLDCSSTLSEELIAEGARHHLPREPALQLNAHNTEEAIRTFCEKRERCVEELTDSVAETVPRRVLGPGVLYVPVVEDRVPEPALRMRINASLGNYSHFGTKHLEEKELLAWTQEAPVDMGRAAATFCVAHLCPNRIETATLLAGDENQRRRVVVSMSTLPGRISFLSQQLSYLQHQTFLPDTVYVAIPYFSLRERKEYVIPRDLQDAEERGRVVILRSLVDWGPATKLIPVLSVETSPQTVIVTLDDDIKYPSTLLEDLVDGTNRHPSAAVGFRGYRLPPPRSSNNNNRNESEGDSYYSHENLVYVDGADLVSADERVDALGGLAGVAYRSGFFDLRRLVDYESWDGGAFFVDDDWISLVLEEARVPRFVLRKSPAATSLRDDPIVSPHHTVSALNSPDHAFRNIKFQAELLRAARDKDLFATQPCRRFLALKFLERCFDEIDLVPRAETYDRSFTYVFAQSHPSTTSLHVLDDFLAYHGGVQYAVDETIRVDEMNDATSLHTSVHDSISFFWNMTTTLDMFYIGGGSPSPLADFASVLGAGSFKRGHTVLAVENITRPEARSLHRFLLVNDCIEQQQEESSSPLLFRSWQCP